MTLASQQGLPGSLEENAYILPIDLTFDEWQRAGKLLLQIDTSLHWWLADLLIYGENKWPDRYAQLVDVTGLKADTLYNVVWVGRKFPPGERIAGLSFSHHKEVAGIKNTLERRKWLEEAKRESMSSRELRAARYGGEDRYPLPYSSPTVRLPADITSALDSLVSSIDKPECPVSVSKDTEWCKIELRIILG